MNPFVQTALAMGRRFGAEFVQGPMPPAPDAAPTDADRRSFRQKAWRGSVDPVTGDWLTDEAETNHERSIGVSLPLTGYPRPDVAEALPHGLCDRAACLTATPLALAKLPEAGGPVPEYGQAAEGPVSQAPCRTHRCESAFSSFAAFAPGPAAFVYHASLCGECRRPF